jgi:serpin B
MLCRKCVFHLLWIALSMGLITACLDRNDNDAGTTSDNTGTEVRTDSDSSTGTDSGVRSDSGSDSVASPDTNTAAELTSDSIPDTATGTDTDAIESTDSETANNSDTIADSETETSADTDTGSTAGYTVARSDLPHNAQPDVDDVTYQSFVTNMNAFGLDLFRGFVSHDVNVVYSPLSIAMALGMTLPGARNNTADEMALVLHNTLEAALFHAAGNRLMTEMRSRNIAPHPAESGGEKSVQLSLINAIWAQHTLTMESAFLDILAVHYDSGMNLVDFITETESTRLTINDWAAGNTMQKLTNLVPAGALTADTRLVLTNALHFYGSWHKSFKVSETANGNFALPSGTDVSVPLMHLTDNFTYDSQAGYQIVDLPYDGESLVMTIVLPEADQFATIRESIDEQWLNTALATMDPRIKLELTLPRFDFVWDASLTEPLTDLGMTDAFDKNKANFSGISTTEPLFISDVLHKAFIGVDEYGTEAAAATAVIVSTWSDPIPFTADHPFLFFIRDTETGAILFAGQVIDPSL